MDNIDFTSIKLKKIGETFAGEFYSGLANSFLELKPYSFSKDEKKLIDVLKKVIVGGTPFYEIDSIAGLPKDFSDSFRDKITSVIELEDAFQKLPRKEVFQKIVSDLSVLLQPVKFVSDKRALAEEILHSAIGLKRLSFFYLDDDFEELMINSLDSIFIFHKKYGMCRVNITLGQKEFESILDRIANSAGKKFNSKNPLIDARLPDGSRVNATYSEVSPKGHSLTIRKFYPIPITMLDLIEHNVLSSEVAAFLWTMSDGFGVNPKNILIIGGTASGKTTFLNTLSNFIRLNERVISIEDTLELSLLGRSNWVQLEAKHSIEGEVTMDELLKNSLRMRPDRLVVGEVRGKEAMTLFSAMDNGHNGCLGTLHANNAKEAIIKLQERPFLVPQVMLPLIDLVVVLQRNYSREKGIVRRVKQITEVTNMDRQVLLANIFEYDQALDLIKSTPTPSHLMEVFASENSMTKNEVKTEIETRQLILEWMLDKGVRKPEEVLEVIQSYYYDPKKVLSMVYSKK